MASAFASGGFVGTVPAADVHASTLATLNRTYATVVDTTTFLEERGTEPEQPSK